MDDDARRDDRKVTLVFGRVRDWPVGAALVVLISVMWNITLLVALAAR